MIALWGISFISLFLSIFWLLLLLTEEDRLLKAKKFKKHPKISIIVPAHNEGHIIKQVITSLLNLNYPKDKLEIIAVNDDSTDNTQKELKSIKDSRLKVIYRHPGFIGKAAAVNAGIPYAAGEFIGVLDGDTPNISEDCLLYMLPHFKNPKVGAVIGAMKAWKPKNILEKLQWFEYLISTLTRRLLAILGALYVTPGGSFSLFRKSLLDKHGYFDESSLTEDLEMAMRLQHLHYDIKLELNSIAHTKVPNTVKAFHAQRIRWYRGWLQTLFKYRDMMFNKDYNFLGMFQMPISLIIPFFLVIVALTISYNLLKQLYAAIVIFSIVGMDAIHSYLSFKESLLFNTSAIILPMIVVLAIGVYLLNKAQNYLKESWKYPIATIGYFIVYQLILSSYWIAALFHEVKRSKKKW